MFKIAILILLFFGGIWTAKAIEKTNAPSGTVLWEKSDIRTAPVIVLTQPIELQVKEVKQVPWQNSVIYRNIKMLRVHLDGRDYWMAPGWHNDNGKAREIRHTNWGYLLASGILTILAIIIAFRYFCTKQRLQETASLSSKNSWLILSLILLHYAMFSYFRSMFPDTFQTPTDENEYFRIANALRQWDFSKPFTYTIGYPLLCIPFLWLISSDNFYEVSRFISYFSVLAMMPLSIILLFTLCRKICASATKAYIIVILYLIVPKLFMVVEYPSPCMLLSPFGIWHSTYIYSAYMLCLTGFNSLSEWGSVNLLLLTTVVTLCMRGSKFKYMGVGLLFGFALLVRMNNVLWAPLVAYLIWINDRERLSDWRYLLKSTVLSIIPATMIFSSQLAINYMQLGSIFKTPYDLHHEYSGGKIGIQYFSNISQYYFKIETLYFAVALAGLIFTRNVRLRHILILWTLPTFLFFFCFDFAGYPYRFFLAVFPGMLAAMVCSDVWSAQTNIPKKWLLAGILLFLAIPILPFSFHFFDYFQILGASWHGFVNFAYKLRLLLALPVWLTGMFYFRKDRKLCLYLLFFGIMIYEWSHWIMVSVMVGLLLYTRYEWAKELFISIRQKSISTWQ